MIRGTTPTHIFTLPFDTSKISSARVTYAQGEQVVLTKETGACAFDGDTITVRLTQEETLLFSCKKMVEIQLRVRLLDGETMSTDIMRKSISECLDGEVLE